MSRSNTSEITMDIKKCLISRSESGLLVSFDFSQLEIAALAEMTEDPVLIKEMNDGIDIHRANASKWLGRKPEYITDDERRAAKAMTFMIQYGAGINKISTTLGISKGDAQAFLNEFYNKYIHIAKWHSQLSIIKKGFDKSCIGKEELPYNHFNSPVKRTYTILSQESTYKPGTFQVPLTAMKNYPVQGFATGDLVPIFINRINYLVNSYSNSKNLKIILVNTVHDDFTYDLTNAEDLHILLQIVEYSFDTFKEYFKNLFDYDLKVNYSYEMKIGENLSETTKLTRKDIKELLKEHTVEV